jgi:hypothetical protein
MNSLSTIIKSWLLDPAQETTENSPERPPNFSPYRSSDAARFDGMEGVFFAPGPVAAEDEGSAGAASDVGPVCAGSCAVTLATIGAEAARARCPARPWPSIGRCQNTLTNLLPKAASSLFHAVCASSLDEKLARAFELDASTATFVTVPKCLNQPLTISSESLSSGIFSTTRVLSCRSG